MAPTAAQTPGGEGSGQDEARAAVPGTGTGTGTRTRSWPKVDRYILKQIAAAVIFSQTHSVVGAIVGFTSVFIIQEADSERGYLTQSQITWVVSAMPIGLMAGNVLSTLLTPVLGYRRVIQLTAPVSVVSWLALGLTFDFPLMVAARAMTGLTVGVADGPVRAYIGETSSECLRGVLGILPQVCTTANMLVVYGIASQTSWRYAVLVCGIAPSVVQFFGTLVLPDAAKWLISHGFSEDSAHQSIMFFRGSRETADKEIEEIRASLQGGPNLRPSVISRVRALFVERRHRRPFLLLLFQLFLFVFNAGEAVANFTTVIFAAATSEHNPYYCTIFVVLARLVGFFISAWLIERAGRARLLQGAALFQMSGSIIVGLFFYYRSSLSGHGWLVLVGTLIIYFSYGIGIAPVTWVYFSELPANAVRSVCLNILLVWFGLMMFSFVHSYISLEEAIGNHGVFWLFAVLNGVQILFAQFCLPETRGMSLESIQNSVGGALRQCPAGQDPTRGGRPAGAPRPVPLDGAAGVARRQRRQRHHQREIPAHLCSRSARRVGADCIRPKSFDVDRMRVVIGQHDRRVVSEGERRMPVASVTLHDFDERTVVNDLALIRLKEKVTWGPFVQPICLPDQPLLDEDPDDREVKAVVAGWGLMQESTNTKKPKFADVLQWTEVPIISRAQCQEWLREGGGHVVTSSQLCAGYRDGGRDSCLGDSGGPLVVRQGGRSTLVGIVSYGEGCARRRSPGIYTSVYEYLPWIRDRIEEDKAAEGGKARRGVEGGEKQLAAGEQKSDSVAAV